MIRNIETGVSGHVVLEKSIVGVMRLLIRTVKRRQIKFMGHISGLWNRKMSIL